MKNKKLRTNLKLMKSDYPILLEAKKKTLNDLKELELLEFMSKDEIMKCIYEQYVIMKRSNKDV